MNIMARSIEMLLLLIALAALLVSCSKKEEETRPSGTVQARSQGSASDAAAGVRWSVPHHWVVQPPRQMRVATYSISVSGNDAGGAECAVFYFGKQEGGDVESNVSRWVGQFENASQPKRSERTISGRKVYLVDVTGTYLSPGGPMMQSQGKREGYRLLGAIAEAPEGMVFFKLTGPSGTVAEAESDFIRMIESIRTG